MRQGGFMKWPLLFVAIAGVAHADSLPTIPGVCNDLDACEQACYKKGQIAACVTGGVIAMQDADNDAQMKKRGIALFDKACMKGHTESCHYVGKNSDDDAKALKYYERACNLQYAPSCVELGNRLSSADDDKSKKTAMVFYKKAIGMLEPRCDAKEADACAMLVELYEQMVNECRARLDRACQAGASQQCEQN